MIDYTEGPADQPWEVSDNLWAGRSEPFWWIQRAGYAVRLNPDDENAPYEWRFGSTTDCGKMEPHELAARLNDLDRARADLAALESAYTALTGQCQARIERIARLEARLAALCDAVASERATEWVDVRTATYMSYVNATDDAVQAARELLEGGNQ